LFILIKEIDLGSAWTALPFLGKLFFLFLAAVTTKTLYSSAVVLVAARAIAREVNTPIGSHSVGRLDRTLASLRQLHLFTLFGFWFCISVLALDGYVSIESSKLTGAAHVLDHFRYCFIWSACISCVLL